MLLWFNLISENKKVSMGSSIETDTKPEFEVKAMGSFIQKPGCPEDAYTALGEERVGRNGVGRKYKGK